QVPQSSRHSAHIYSEKVCSYKRYFFVQKVEEFCVSTPHAQLDYLPGLYTTMGLLGCSKDREPNQGRAHHSAHRENQPMLHKKLPSDANIRFLVLALQEVPSPSSPSYFFHSHTTHAKNCRVPSRDLRLHRFCYRPMLSSLEFLVM